MYSCQASEFQKSVGQIAQAQTQNVSTSLIFVTKDRQAMLVVLVVHSSGVSYPMECFLLMMVLFKSSWMLQC